MYGDGVLVFEAHNIFIAFPLIISLVLWGNRFGGLDPVLHPAVFLESCSVWRADTSRNSGN